VNFIIQRVFRSDEELPIREVLAGGYATKDAAVRGILEHFPDDVSYRMLDHSGNKRRRIIMEGKDLFYEVFEINDLDLVDVDPWPLPEPDQKEAK